MNLGKFRAGDNRAARKSLFLERNEGKRRFDMANREETIERSTMFMSEKTLIPKSKSYSDNPLLPLPVVTPGVDALAKAKLINSLL